MSKYVKPWRKTLKNKPRNVYVYSVCVFRNVGSGEGGGGGEILLISRMDTAL